LSKARDRENRVRTKSDQRGSRLPAPHSSTTLRHSVRATRTAGQKMRSRLLDVASTLFKAHGLNGTSITAIAGASDAFPSQVTYYFGSKEALFVEAACRDMLHIAERAEKAGARARTPKGYTEAVVDSVMGANGIVLFVEALVLARQRPDLLPQIARTIDRLHIEGTRAHAGQMARHGWQTRHPSDVLARRFWTIALGTAIEGYALGRSATAMSKAMRETLGELGEARSAGTNLRLVNATRPSTKLT
jgi:AcrR family transcriptional regulator